MGTTGKCHVNNQNEHSMNVHLSFAPGTPVSPSTSEIQICVAKELSLESHGGDNQALIALELLDSLIEGIINREFSVVAWIYFAMILGKHCESRYYRSSEKRIMEGLQFVRAGLTETIPIVSPSDVTTNLAKSVLAHITSTVDLPIQELSSIGRKTDNWDTQYFFKLITRRDGSYCVIDEVIREVKDLRAFIIHLDLLPRDTAEEQAIFSYYLLAAVAILLDFLDGYKLDFELGDLFRFVWEELLSSLMQRQERHLVAKLITYISYAAVGQLLAAGNPVAARALMACPRETLDYFQGYQTVSE